MRGAGAGRAAVLVAASAALVLLPAVPASAHNYVVATTPAEGSTVTEQPGTVSLTTNDALLDFDQNTVLQVVGPDGRHYETACAVVDEATAGVPAELGPAGAYTVVWQVVSTDGHPISGEFTFDWVPAEGGQATGAGSDTSPCASAGDADGAKDGGSDAPTPSAEPAAPAPAALGDVLWIAGGAIAVIAAALATWLVVRRRGD